MANNLNFDAGTTFSAVNAVMSAGTGSSYTTTTTTECVINGKWGTTLGAQTNTATPTTDATSGAAFVALTPNQACMLVLGVNLAGAIKMCQGPAIGTNIGVTTTVGTLLNDPQPPAFPADFCPLAYTIVQTAPSASPWTPGTSSWTASGVSATTFQNVAGQLPNRPQAS